MVKIQFHWRMLQGGESGMYSRSLAASLAVTGLPDLAQQVAFCDTAAQVGIDGLLVDIGADNPDPILLCTALGLASKKVGLIVAVRSGLIPPTTFVQQINTLSSLIGGERILLNIVAGDSPKEQRYYGDFLDHDLRYARTEEFLAVCRGLWQDSGPLDYDGNYFKVQGARLNTPFLDPERDHPLMFIAGGSRPCRELSISQGSCWMTLGHSPEVIAEKAEPVLAAGKQVGLRLSVIVRPTRARALEAARSLVEGLKSERAEAQTEADFVKECDSVSIRSHFALADQEWLTHCLWTGAVRSHGAPAICLVGDPDEVAEALMAYRRVGVTHFILSGWPKQESMIYFGNEVIPRVRALEKRERLSLASSGALVSARAHEH